MVKSIMKVPSFIHLNSLPATYLAFKTAIRTQLRPMNLDDFYSFLCNEEINQTNDSLEIDLNPNPQLALTANHQATRGHGSKYRGCGTSHNTSTPHVVDALNLISQLHVKYIIKMVTPLPLVGTDRTWTTYHPAEPFKKLHSLGSLILVQMVTSATGGEQVLVGNEQSVSVQHYGNDLFPTLERKANQVTFKAKVREDYTQFLPQLQLVVRQHFRQLYSYPL
ncbi:uncharacterized protein LOC110028567 [Phalaenopsis equestris]|uniref:uncharacterized protein LOC110028567 n=1 Tax=Phalaenopsis equestris TaxID=78828 RepID=UPI0009E5A6B5|nr:uncharacterized protein LOC110028567 [Phalaenopsis equestris]XP_020586131.1 uncharacterized protein LOC110028567 [Phalaenopsis equestris]